MATSFRFLYRTASNACRCQCKSIFSRWRRRSTRAETCRKQNSVVDHGQTQKPLFAVCPADVDGDDMPLYSGGGNEMTTASGCPAPGTTGDDADKDNEETGDAIPETTDDADKQTVDMLPIGSCVAAMGVAMATVATSNNVRRQSTIVRLTRLQEKIGAGLHSADNVRVPVWLSLLLVVVYIAVGALMFSAWESVGVTSESFVRLRSWHNQRCTNVQKRIEKRFKT